MRVFLQRSALVTAAFASCAAAAHGQTGCSGELKELRAQASHVEVKLSSPAQARAGERLEIKWKSDAKFFDGIPTYLVLAVPAEVRFEGDYREAKPKSGGEQDQQSPSDIRFEHGVYGNPPNSIGPGFFAVTSKLRGPHAISFGVGKMRAFVPLHAASTQQQGRITIRPYRDGPLALEWGVIANGPCGEWKLAGTQLPAISVYSGVPEIVVFDAAIAVNDAGGVKTNHKISKRKTLRGFVPVGGVSTGTDNLDRPLDVVLSNSGAYRMHVYHGRYLVFETASETLILDRSGDRPAFSPTSRFVAAVVAAPTNEEDEGAHEGTKFEIVDLISRRSEFAPDGLALAWGMDDSFVISDHGGGMGFELWSPLIGNADPRGAAHPIGSGGGSGNNATAWGSLGLSLDLDAGVIEFGMTSDGIEAYELATGLPFVCKTAPPCFPGSISNKASGVWTDPPKWQIQGSLKFTHTFHSHTFSSEQDRLLARHKSVLQTSPKTGVLSPRMTARRSVGWRGLTAIEGPVPVRQGGFRIELQHFGIGLLPNDTSESLVSWQSSSEGDTAKFKYSVAKIEAQLVATVPIAKNSLLRPPRQVDGSEGKLKFVLKDHARGLWRWREGGNTFWLAQILDIQGSGSFGVGALYLFRPDGAQGSLQDLTETLGEARLSRYGVPGTDPQLKVFVSQSRYLLLATPLGKALAIYDLEQRRRVAKFTEVEQTHIVEELNLTEDGAYLVQRNSDGSFALHSIATGKRTLSGRYVDGEIVLYNDQGYYDATYEGGHFVHLRFPGAPGLHTFHQFSANLKRPDIVRSLLKGEDVSLSSPQISPPPTVALTFERSSGHDLALRVKARSREGLQAIRLYQDGLLTQEIPVTGDEADISVVIPRSTGARWLTAIANDSKGVFSLPAEYQLPAISGPLTSLRGVAIGVDRYQNSRLGKLNFAASDARNFAVAAMASRGRYYGRVDLTSLTDLAATPARVMEALRQTVADAVPNDTVVFFFSGHGLRSSDGGFYLATTATDPNNLDTTALSWSRVGKLLQESKARVLVLIDACHSGLAGELAFASNDGAVSQMMSGTRAPIVIIAASKGRQRSQELSAIRGGAFTRSLEAVIAKDRTKHDVNKNGSIEISELYAGVKRLVIEVTAGQQTPWLARSDLIGDFAIF